LDGPAGEYNPLLLHHSYLLIIFQLTQRSGKSSLILLLLRLLDPILSSNSNITIDSLSLLKLKRQSLRKHLIAIPQDSFLIEHLTWRQNLQPGDNNTDEEYKSVLQDVGLLDIITREGGLNGNAKPDALSHGQKQLFNLARAVLKGRQKAKRAQRENHASEHGYNIADAEKVGERRCGGILLLDEISSSVDEGTEKAMLDIIMREFAAYTILAVAHRENSVRGFDRVVELADGRIKSTGIAGTDSLQERHNSVEIDEH
jgi:ATP-binding cassette, subfamily C (CFTR/MRP), member 1